MVAKLAERVSNLEVVKDDAVPGPRVRLFVTEVVQPIKESVGKIEGSITRLAEESKELYDAHKAFIDAEQKRKEKEQEERTVSATLKRWGAVSGAVGAIWLLFRVVGTIIEVYIQSRGGR